MIEKIITAGLYGPQGSIAGLSLQETRKIFVFTQGTEKMQAVKNILLATITKNAKRLGILVKYVPFLRTYMGAFAQRLAIIAKQGLPGLDQAPYYIVIAEKKWFPPVEKQSLAHALQNMRLTATDLGLGMQLLSATSLLSKDKDFLNLLGLKKGYALDACLVGYAAHYPGAKPLVNPDEFTTWII